MHKQNKIIIILLAVSLILNCYTLLKMNVLRELIAHDFEDYFEVAFEEDIDEIRDAIDQIKQEQQWISEVDIKNGGIADDKQIVKLSWQVKDYALGSELRFYYRKSGEEDFQQLSGTYLPTGSFEVELEIAKEGQPEWVVSYQHDDEEYEMFRKLEKESSYKYEYYVVLDEGNRILSSEVENLNFRKVLQVYSLLDIDVLVDKEGMPSNVKLSWDEENIIPDKIFVKLYDDNKLVKEDELKVNIKSSAKWKPDSESFDKVILKVQYADGKDFEEEIWDRNKLYDSNEAEF